MEKCEIFAERDMIVAVPEGGIESREYPEIERLLPEASFRPACQKSF